MRLRGAELLPDPAAVAAVAAAAPEILAQSRQCAVAGHAGDWTLAGIDTDGCDVAQAETVLRVPWPAPAADAAAIHAALRNLLTPAI